MAPINETNQAETEKLAYYSQIKHVHDNYLRIAIIDDKHLFLTKAPPLNNETTDKLAYFDNMLYTNDLEYIQRMKEMLNEAWKRYSIDRTAIKEEPKKLAQYIIGKNHENTIRYQRI